MNNIVLIMIIIAIIAYLCGSINASIIFSNCILHKDIRTIGSGNAGFTNSLRTGNTAFAVLTFVCDFTKVCIAVLVGGLLMSHCFANIENSFKLGAYISGLFAMLGHIFPVFFGFRGGKGVISLVAMLFFTDWRVALICCAVWGILFILTKIVSLSVLITLPIYVIFTVLFKPSGSIVLLNLSVQISTISIGAAVLMSFIIVLTHRSNIKRLLNGTENTFAKHE